MKKINIYLYKTPGVNKKIAQGILEGLDEFLKLKVRLKTNYKIGEWSKIEKGNESYLNIFLTKNSITRSKLIKGKNFVGNIVFKTQNLNDLRDYIDGKSNINYLRVLRGKITGYNQLARLFNLNCCNNEHCVFNFDKRDLDTLAFMLHLNKEMPLCDYHRAWNLL